MSGQVISRDRLGELSRIGQGGQGVVYRAPNVKTKFASSMVYKEYKAHTRAEIDFIALAAMPTLVEDALSYAQAERLVSIGAWPCALVEDDGVPTGFVMPAIPDSFFIALTTVKGVSQTTAEFQHLLNHSTVLAARGIDIDDVQRLTLLRETASALAFLHRDGVCVGDVSPKNLLFSLDPHEAVYFIDCDAMRINGISALTQVQTPGWQVPDGEELATVYSDAYKLGLLALRLLAGDQETTNPQHLPPTTPAMLRQLITDSLASQPDRRPLPEAWTYVLGHAIEHAQHQEILAAQTPPASAPLTPPTPPTVRSRPTKPPPKPPPKPPKLPASAASVPPHFSPDKRHPAWIIGAATVVGVILAVVIVSLVRSAQVEHENNAAYATTTATTTTSPASVSPALPAPPAPTYTPEPTTTTAPPSTYAAVAVATSGAWGAMTNSSTENAAKDGAMSGCAQYANDCKVLSWNENGCVAVVNGNGLYQGGHGPSRDDAVQDALQENNGGQFVMAACSWDHD